VLSHTPNVISVVHLNEYLIMRHGVACARNEPRRKRVRSRIAGVGQRRSQNLGGEPVEGCRKRVCHRVGNGSVIFVFFHYSLLPRLERWRRATAFAHLFLFYPSRSFLDTTLLLSPFLPSQLQVSFLASSRPACSNRVPARLTPFLLHVSFFSSLPSRADLLFLLLQHLLSLSPVPRLLRSLARAPSYVCWRFDA
jgi:hypothetical protein